MMKSTALAVVATAVLAVGGAYAQDRETTGSTQGDPTPRRGERTIEWPAGVEAMSAATRSIFPPGAADNFAEAPIPVMAPSVMSATDRAAFSHSFRAMSDGYFGVLPGNAYDVIINGTRNYSVAPAEARVVQRDTREYLFEEAEGGAHLAFNRFGADYILEFECHAPPSNGGSCISEAEAAAFADGMTIVGGGGR